MTTTYQTIQHLPPSQRAAVLRHLSGLILRTSGALTTDQLEGFAEDVRTLTGEGFLGPRLVEEWLTSQAPGSIKELRELR
jgi:hypothetical protein